MSVTVQASETGFDVKQCAGDVHQGAVINLFGLGAQVFYQFDLLGHHFSRYPQTQHGQGIGHLAQTWEQVLKLTVLAQL